MRLTAPLRLILGALLVTAGTALIWWLGYTIGKGALSGQTAGNAFRRAFDLDEGNILRILFLAFAGALVAAAAGGAGKWMTMAGIALGAALLFPDKGIGQTLGVILFVFCAAGVADSGVGIRDLIPSAVAGVVVAVAFSLEGPYDKSEVVAVSLLRGLLYYLPLLALPSFAEKYVLKRLSA